MDREERVKEENWLAQGHPAERDRAGVWVPWPEVLCCFKINLLFIVYSEVQFRENLTIW